MNSTPGEAPVPGAHAPATDQREVQTVSEPETTWLTQGAYDRLKQELQELIANRPIIAEDIGNRREEGDLRENQAYQAAREDQGKQEARIRQLQHLLNHARVGVPPQDRGVASPGMMLTVRYEDEGETESFLLASRAAGTEGPIEVYSPESPLGRALLGAREGETREYEVPSGDSMHVTLLKAEPYQT
jgi:transcription elongation factor GreA